MILDFRTLLVVFTVLRLLQAAGLLYVWRIHRGYRPARDWAAGAVLITTGTLLVALRDAIPPGLSILGGNLFLFTGILIFDGGIARACGREPPWRVGLLLLVAAAAAQWWFTDVVPSTAARVMVLTVLIVVCDGYAAMAALRVPAGPLRGTQWLISTLLVVEAGLAVVRGVSAMQTDLGHVLQSTLAQTVFILTAIATTFLISLVLAILTSQRLQVELHHAARHDPLTGLLNRRALADFAARDWARLQRHGGNLVALVLDLDHFKALNDRSGHAAGDSVLAAVAEAIGREMRIEDRLCRYGGEEFVALLPDTNSAQGMVLAERLRRVIANIRLPEIVDRAITASIGIAERIPDDRSWEQVVEAADQALYEAKTAGRDRVVIRKRG